MKLNLSGVQSESPPKTRASSSSESLALVIELIYSSKMSILDYFLLVNSLLRSSTEIGVKTDFLSKSE